MDRKSWLNVTVGAVGGYDEQRAKLADKRLILGMLGTLYLAFGFFLLYLAIANGHISWLNAVIFVAAGQTLNMAFKFHKEINAYDVQIVNLAKQTDNLFNP